MRPRIDVVVIGGGFYGSVLALHAAEVHNRSTMLVEREPALLERASYANQARVHRGYHYPRSLVTGYRSRANFDRFLDEYGEAIDNDFGCFYAIGRAFSNVTAEQFRLYCERIDAPIGRAPAEIRELFEPEVVEEVFEAREAVFDAVRLRALLATRLASSGVELRLNTEATAVTATSDGLELTLRDETGDAPVTASHVFDCTYSRVNQLRVASDLPAIPLKHELAELALVTLPAPLAGIGITLMCGPFFSVMPFPPLGISTLSHVRYTPLCEWTDGTGATYRDPHEVASKIQKRSRFVEMVKDASRYVPSITSASYRDSIWETKTVLPRSEVDDSRPILFRRNSGLIGLHTVMGSKIDNVYDMMDAVSQVLGSQT